MSGKRRVINDSDDDSDDKAHDGASPLKSSPAVFDVKSQLKKRLEQTQARAAASKKRRLDQEQEKEKQQSKLSEEQSTEKIIIPKKTKNVDASTASSSSAPSLLSAMKQNPTDSKGNSKFSAPTSMAVIPGSRAGSPSTRPVASSAVSNNPPTQGHNASLHGNHPYKDRQSDRTFDRMQPPRSSTPIIHQQQQEPQQPPPSTLRASNETKPPIPRNIKLEQMIWDSLDVLCQSHSKDLSSGPIAHPSLYSTSSQDESSNPTIDMSASLIRSKQSQNPIENDENLDFFDLDDQGCIVMQPTIPMFPEDFPVDSEQKTWPLSWFGIVDPELENAQKSKRGTTQMSSKEDAHSGHEEQPEMESSLIGDKVGHESPQSSLQVRRGSIGSDYGGHGRETVDRDRRSVSRSKEKGDSWQRNDRDRYNRGRYSPPSRPMHDDGDRGSGRGRVGGRGMPPLPPHAAPLYAQPHWDAPHRRNELRDGSFRGGRRGFPPPGVYRSGGDRPSSPRDHPGTYGPADGRPGPPHPPPYGDSSRPPHLRNFPPPGGPDRDGDHRPRDRPFRDDDRGRPRGNRRYNDR